MSNPKGKSTSATQYVDRLKVPVEALHWHCDPAQFKFKTTQDVEPVAQVIGQDKAVEALNFGLSTTAPGQNIFVRGLTGTGRMTLLKELLESQDCPLRPAPERCYVHNFLAPERPRLISLTPGLGERFRQRIDELISFIQNELPKVLTSDTLQVKRSTLEEAAQADANALTAPFDKQLREDDLTLVTVTAGTSQQPMIMPLIKGQPVPPTEFARLQASGKLDEKAVKEILAGISAHTRDFDKVTTRLMEVHRSHRKALQALLEAEIRNALSDETTEVRQSFNHEAIDCFLAELEEDVILNQGAMAKGDEGFLHRYQVNLLSAHSPGERHPIVMEITPTMRNLLGTIERSYGADGRAVADHSLIRAGAILRADGGYLVLEVHDLLMESGAWKVLVRALRTGKLEIVPPEFQWPWFGPSLQPEPIEIQLKVVLLGDPETYALLDAYDTDFPHLFKVLADFDTTIPQDAEGLEMYAAVLARIASEEKLLPFDRGAMAAIAEQGARVAARQDRLTARFGRLADIAREAAFIAQKSRQKVVRDADIHEATRLMRGRADLPARRFREYISDGTIRIQTSGTVVGQVNGLAVSRAGPITYGFPARITATIGAGTAGTINIEREAELSGALHTKGFYILGGLLRHLLKTDHPLAFSASIAFEQTYGGIDGDSASAAEACCLLSALTNIPLRQDIALTGAIDQLGHVQPVGAVSEKLEGFFDVCKDMGLSGTQGAIIPRANVRDLMLRSDVIAACAKGRFQIYAVETIEEALIILSGYHSGERDEEGLYPADSLLGIAEERAGEYWQLAIATGETIPETRLIVPRNQL